MLQDVRDFPPGLRRAKALKLHDAKGVRLPPLKHFNTDPCPDHESIEEGALAGCYECGVEFRKHQAVAVPWLWMVGKGLLADSMGLGKTISFAGLLAMVKETGELSPRNRCVMVCGKKSAIPQHRERLRGLLRDVVIDSVIGTDHSREERVEKYMAQWEVMIITQQTFVNDLEMFERLGVNMLVADDLDSLRNPGNKAAYAFKRLAYQCDRVVVMSGTPLQKRLKELHSVLEPIGGLEAFGPLEAFMARHVVVERVQSINPRTGRVSYKKKEMGCKNMAELRRKVAPLALRRTAVDVDDVSMPALVPSTVWLDLNAHQAKAYKQLREGARMMIKRDGRRVTRAKAAAAFMLGQQICSGMASLDVADESCKLDWLMDQLGSDLSEEKVVVFVNFKKNIRALHARLDAVGVGHVTIWGDDPSVEVREAARKRFWSDPGCQVLIGTTAIEQSINLQCSRHLVYVDTILNPARMSQMAGRIRRDGSRFETVYVHHLLTGGTQEEGYLNSLRKEQAIADSLWQEGNDQFEALSAMQMLQLISE